MDPPVVHVEKEPFEQMLLAAVDPFKKECFGYIFGKKPSRTGNEYVVSKIQIVQSVIRPHKFTEVEHMKRSKKRMFDIFRAYPKLYPLMGDFHSHPEYGSDQRSVELSVHDIQDMSVSSWCEIAFVVRISSRSTERLEWISKSGGGVRGSFGDYVVDINVYRLTENNGSFVPESLQIISPAIKALNRENNRRKKR